MATEIFNSAHEECPRYEFCNINNCPLHKDYNKILQNDPSDPSQQKKDKCVAKSIRKRIGLKWKLENQGMTSREKKSQENWNNLPEDVKNERIAKLKKLSPVSRLLASGHTIIPPRQDKGQNPHTNEVKTPENDKIQEDGSKC
jgi:hypothetical protein